MLAGSLVTRRQALIGGIGAGCCAALAASALARSASAGLPGPPRDAPSSGGPGATWLEIAPGVRVRRGALEDATATNDDAIANTGFVVGREAVAVIDPGGSLRDGERLRTSIRQVTSLPIRYVVLSHVHPDHIFGAGAFREDRPRFVGHHRLPKALSTRGEYYRRNLETTLGAGRAGPVVMPDLLIREPARIELGDRTLQLVAHELAHSDCDLTVLDAGTGTLFAGDLLFAQRVPSLDGSLRGWLRELQALKAVPARRAVPGHGPASVDWPAGSADLERYLNVLLRETRDALAKGLEIDAAVETVARSERTHWKLFDAYHGHNVTQAFKELEWE
jgi:quinoprotein relay system zinc metallohydrolase 2